MKEKVTIVVPIYNVEKYVEKCINSLTNQSFKEIKIYAINDGSTDNSAKIVSNLAKKDNRINLINKENGGYGSVLEYAIKIINTKYFIICDPDDWLTNDCIETLYNIAEQNKLDIAIGNKYLFYNDGTQIVDKFENYFYDLKPNIIYTKDIERFAFFPPSPHAKLFKTEITKKIEFPHKVSYTDLILYTISLKYAKRIMYISNPLAYYLLERPGNTRTDRKPTAIKNHIIVWSSILNQIDSNDKKLIYRLYKELKYITKIYYRNSDNLFKDELYFEIIDCIEKLKIYYDDIKKNFTKKSINKLELFLIFRSKRTLRIFIKIRKMLNK